MGIEMPDINKIRKELDEKNAEMEKKEREKIKEEYEKLSGQEKPTEEKPEEKIEEKKDKREESEEKKKEGEKEGIKDEDIIQKLTPGNIKAAENVKAAYKKGKFIEVKIKRPSGEIEDGWVISNINPKTGEATVLKFTSEKEKEGKDRSFVDEIVTLAELKEWNKSETGGPEEKKEDSQWEKTEIDKKETDELLKGAKEIDVEDIINEKTKKKKEKESATTKTPGSEIEGSKEKEKEDLEKEITGNFYDELKKIKDMPDKAEGFNKTAKLKMKKTEKCFELIDSWKDLAYLDNYKGIKNIFSELDKLKPSIFLYNLKKAQITNDVAKSMALNYKEWGIEDKKKLKIIKNFVNKQSEEENIFYSKDKTLKGIAQILALKDIPFKNNIDVIVKEIKNPDIKSKTIAKILEIENKSIEGKKELLKETKENIAEEKMPSEEKIKEQIKKMGASEEIIKALEDPEIMSRLFTEGSKFLAKGSEILKNTEVQKKVQELKNVMERIAKEKGEIPDSVAKAKEHIEKKGSAWGTAFEGIGLLLLILVTLSILLGTKFIDDLSGQATGKKKKEKK